MRLYRSKRFAVYQASNISIVVFGDRGPPMKLNQYYFIFDEDDMRLILTMLNEENRDDIDALLGAYVAMENPHESCL